MKNNRVILLSLVSNEPPKEFRILRSGWNKTLKGDLLFDDKAAKSVMDSYENHGVERPIDLEHLSIDNESENFDPDARGWFKLEVRDGELWAVDVRWTPDGERRLKEKTQRYISPFLTFDPDTKRVVSVFNVAICAVPATIEAPALVAASLRSGKKFGTLSVEATKMDEMKKILSALGLGEDATMEDCLAAIKALQEDEGGEEKGDSEEVMKALRAKYGLADDAKKEDYMKALGELSDPDKDGDKDSKEKMTALSSAVVDLSRQVSELRASNEKETIEKLVADNTDKIPLSLEGWAKTQTPKQLRAFLSAMPSTPRAKVEKDQGQAKEPVLSEEERSVALSAGIDPKIVLERKKKKAEEAKERAKH